MKVLTSFILTLCIFSYLLAKKCEDVENPSEPKKCYGKKVDKSEHKCCYISYTLSSDGKNQDYALCSALNQAEFQNPTSFLDQYMNIVESRFIQEGLRSVQVGNIKLQCNSSSYIQLGIIAILLLLF